jgi:hypothetical protein
MDAQWIFEHFLEKRNLSLCSADFDCGGSSVLVQGESWLPLDENPEVFALPTTGHSGERVMVPLMVDHPEGIRHFHLEMVYPQDLLEYVGLVPSPLTKKFAYLKGEENIPGSVDIEGFSETGITEIETGSLCVVVFQAKKDIYGSAPILLNDLGGDVFRTDTDIESIVKVRPKYFMDNENIVTLGRDLTRDGLFIVPVEVSSAFGMKAFGLDVNYSSDRLTFLRINRTELTKDFVAVDGNEIESGVVRIGGYSTSGIQDVNSGMLVELVFQVKQSGGKVEMVDVMDDLEEFTMLNAKVNSPHMNDRDRLNQKKE